MRKSSGVGLHEFITCVCLRLASRVVVPVKGIACKVAAKVNVHDELLVDEIVVQIAARDEFGKGDTPE